VSRPEGAVGIIWVYNGILVWNDGALKAGKKLYISVCGLCVARDSMGSSTPHISIPVTRAFISQSALLAAPPPAQFESTIHVWRS
jgi:hypothetical protein